MWKSEAYLRYLRSSLEERWTLPALMSKSSRSSSW
jgi:hypothetical protein